MKKYQKILVVIGILLFVTFCILHLNPGYFFTPSSIEYIVLAKSIASGQGYRDLAAPGSPLYSKFPFLYPFLLVPLVSLFPHNIIIYKLLNIFFGVLTFFLIVDFFRRLGLKPILTLAVFFLCAFNPEILYFSSNIMSEIPYLFFSLLTFCFLIEYEKKISWRNRYLFLTGFIMAGAYLTRSIGLALFGSMIICYLIRKEFKKTALLGGLFILLILPWTLRDIQASKVFGTVGESYLHQIRYGDPFTPLGLKRFWSNTIFYLRGMGEIILPFKAFKSLIWVTASIIIIGWLSRLRKRLGYLEPYLLLYLGGIIIFPNKENRYLVPLIPFLFYYLIMGIEMTGNGLAHLPVNRFLRFSGLPRRLVLRGSPFSRFKNSLLGLVISVLLVTSIITDVRSAKFNLLVQPGMELKIIGEWLKKNTSQNAVIMGTKALYLESGRKVVDFNSKIASISSFESAIECEGVTYLIVPSEGEISDYDTMISSSTKFNFIPQVNVMGTVVYKIEKKAQSEKEKKEYEESIRSLKKRIEDNPKDADSYNILGFFYHKNKKYAQAAREFEKAVKLEPGSPEFRCNLATSYLFMEKYDEALKEYQKTLESEFVHNLREIIKKNMTIAHLKWHIIHYPNNPNIALLYNKVGMIWYEKGTYDKAIEALEKAAELAPGIPWPHYNLGRAYEADGQIEKAKSAYKKVLSINPDFTLARMKLERLGKKKVAISSEKKIPFSEIIFNSPDNSEAHYQVGLMYAQRGEIDKAIKEFEKAVSLDQEFTMVYLNLGRSYETKEEYEKALETYKKAFTLDPGLKNVQMKIKQIESILK